jgi:hypothetical protein
MFSSWVENGCEIWSLILREEQDRRIGRKNRILRRVFGAKRDEVTGGWRKLLQNVYSSASQGG